MMFNFFKHKEKETPKTFEGIFISDEEIKEMVKSKEGTFIKKEFQDIDEMIKGVKQYFE